MLLCHYAEQKRIVDNRISHIICVWFLLPLSVCIQHASFMRIFFSIFGEFQVPPIGLEYEPQCVERIEWIHLDANILEMMPRKKRSFWYV